MMVQVGMHNLQALELARTWIGTPYKHQAALKTKGCDCIGLVIGVWRELYGKDPRGFTLPAYNAWWAEETGRSLMVEMGGLYLDALTLSEALPGDILMFSMVRGGPTKHCGIMTAATNMIHAYSGHNVIETVFPFTRTCRLTHAFRYPENPLLAD